MPKNLPNLGKECHDCGQNGPEWCSMNHGVLVCDECCSVHLSLGRHISQIKSFQRSTWSSNQLNLINELSSNGANLIWEYSLRDPQNKITKKKPLAKDALPIKADFIRAKYQQMTFINRLKDETNTTFEDLNLQLHSIVRTDNILTCLRFLSQGADPNFRNPETGTSSIHVAASRGQLNQIELLCIYGGDPATVDAAGISPEEHARTNGYHELADRLIELQYELTDRLINFIGGKQPDHKTGPHIILPEWNDNLNKSAQVFFARQKLQQLSDTLLEDLTMDVFDEVERRELKTIWQVQVDKSLIPLHVVPFLPVNPSFSATRNQGRQKLARYGEKEFQNFIYDILNEISQRYQAFLQQQSPVLTMTKRLTQDKNDSTTALINAFIGSDDDDNFYDKVASDDEYSNEHQTNQQKRTKHHKKTKKFPTTTNGCLFDDTNKLFDSSPSSDLKSRIANTEVQVKYLACAHLDLKNELAVLHQMIQRLLDDNLSTKLNQQILNKQRNSMLNKSTQQIFDNFSRKSSPFIESDYDNTTIIEDPENRRSFIHSYDLRSSRSMQKFPHIDENSLSDFRISRSRTNIDKISPISIEQQSSNKQDVPIVINRSRSYSGSRNKLLISPVLMRKGSYNQIEMNFDIDRRTRKITQRIAEFFALIQDNQTAQYSNHAELINNSVQDMIRISERMISNDDIRANLNMLSTSTQELLLHTTFKENYSTMQIQYLIDDCYSIALATRNLLSLYEKI